MVDRIVAYVMHIRRIKKQFNFHDADIAMNETPVWIDMVSNTTENKFKRNPHEIDLAW